MPIPTKTLGSTGVTVTRLGLGGEGVLRTFGREVPAGALIEAALAGGITYLESARAYAGSERYYGTALRGRRDGLFIASKAHDRTRHGALAMLETTLTAMRLDVLDLWQFHDIREWSEVEALADPGGAYAAFVEAKARGLVRFIGVTGHHDPAVLQAAVERAAFDTVLLPVNPAEGCLPDAFERTVIPAARARGMGVVGMKVFAAGLLFGPAGGGIGVDEALRYALSADVDTVVAGFNDPGELAAAATAAARFEPLAEPDRRALEARVAAAAPGLAYYRGSAASASA